MKRRMSAFMLAVLLLFVPADADAALGSETLHPGDRGEDVEELQEALQQEGFHSGKTDGVYGSVTTSSVKAFQKYEGLTTDGVAGEATLGKLS
ncbi:peptidoglycan-binding domain-containing protein [Marinococcus halotolerans]|uniref:peptidoglycan-binding domain-containing protein n=1 Tax=Marinococcus halotolerans TaxID=301092 RepID=UPI0003FD2036|nr:peptidoglycan-binding domain-containing protein [Marinococcus halotolerans]